MAIPIYCDNRVAFPFQKSVLLAQEIASQLTALYGRDIVIAGVATGAIGIGMLVAHQMNLLSFTFVRKRKT